MLVFQTRKRSSNDVHENIVSLNHACSLKNEADIPGFTFALVCAVGAVQSSTASVTRRRSQRLPVLPSRLGTR